MDEREYNQENGTGTGFVMTDAPGAPETGSAPETENMAGPDSTARTGSPVEPQPMPSQDNIYRFQNVSQQKPARERAAGKTGGAAKGLGKVALSAVVFGVVAAACFFGFTALLGLFKGDGGGDIPYTSGSGDIPVTTVSGTAAGGVTDVSGIVEQVMPSIVAITETSTMTSYFGQRYSSQGAGSGFIVKQDNDQLLIVTNNHVVDSADKITVQFNDGENAAAEVKGSSESNDLAVITVDMNKLKDSTKKSIRVASLGNSDEAKVGQMVIAIGNALGYGQSVTVGYVSAKNREVSTSDETTGKSTTQILMQTDAAINPGNSGGALIDTRGNVIGINSSKYFSYGSTSVEGMGYAIPMSSAVSVINDLMDREVLKDNEKGYLGITGSTIKESENKAYGIPIGVYVRAVSDTGAAYKAGIKQGDVITKINGRKVQSIEAVQEIVNNTKVGTTIDVTVMRSDDGEYKEKEIKVTLKSKDTLDGLEDDSDDSSSQQGGYGNNYDENDSQVVPWGSSIY